MEKRIRLLEQIEILKEYNSNIRVGDLIASLEQNCSVDDVEGTFDVVLIDGKNAHIKQNDGEVLDDGKN